MSDPDDVVIRRSLVEPLPWRVREHPERQRDPRGTCVRETLVALAVRYPPIFSTLQRIERLAPVQRALWGYMQATDSVVQVLGLGHRRELLSPDGVPLPTRHTPEDVLACAQLDRDALEAWAVAAAVLHVMLERPLYTVAVRECLARIPALQPATSWLVPSLLRWLHVRYYEVLFGPFPTDTSEGQRVSPDVPPLWEMMAVVTSPGPPRRLTGHAPYEHGQPLAYRTAVWWAIRVEGTDEATAVEWWHRRMTSQAHRRKLTGLDDAAPDDWCVRAVRTGLKEVAALVSDPS